MSHIGHNGGDIEDASEDRAGNWFAVSRDIFDHPVVGIHDRPFTDMEAWLWLVSRASYETKRVMNKGTIVILDPGDLMAAHGYLSTRWMWSVDKVRWFLKRLVLEVMISRSVENRPNRNTNQIQIISICNYSRYQIIQEAEHQAASQAHTKQAPSQHQEGNTLTSQPKDSPLPPEGGEGGSLFDGIPAEPPKAETIAREVAEAFEVYGKAAAHFGLGQCETHTDARRKRMAKRLADIGGLERFKVALRALGRVDDQFVKLLRGKLPARAGEQPFKLTFDRLLQTDGNLGDVLARLLDIASAKSQFDERPVWLSWTVEEWEQQIERYANGRWPAEFLGPPPGSKHCATPTEVVERKRLLERYDIYGMSKEKH